MNNEIIDKIGDTVLDIMEESKNGIDAISLISALSSALKMVLNELDIPKEVKKEMLKDIMNTVFKDIKA